MSTAYILPPKFTVENIISEGDFVIAIGTIRLKDENGIMASHSYCDVWRFLDGKISGLKAFVIKDL